MYSSSSFSSNTRVFLSEFYYRPSLLFSALARCGVGAFEWIGIQLARLSSFLEYLKFFELWQSAWAIIEPLIQLVASPTWILWGYLKRIQTYAHPVIVWMGSLLLVGIVTWATWSTEHSLICLKWLLKNSIPITVLSSFGVMASVWIFNDSLKTYFPSLYPPQSSSA